MYHLNHLIALWCGITWALGLAITRTHNFRLTNVISHKNFLLLDYLPGWVKFIHFSTHIHNITYEIILLKKTYGNLMINNLYKQKGPKVCMNWVLLVVKTTTTSFVKIHYFLIYKIQLYLLYIRLNVMWFWSILKCHTNHHWFPFFVLIPLVNPIDVHFQLRL